ncbi:AIPR family protein [Yersinia massiliensis]|uniref:AIPR family protein n=1 Tax=Yersinia massiliensis TaxID=419257 RepID=UPI0002EBB7A3|nr:AIPR family protein [Yersinia massiliensis]
MAYTKFDDSSFISALNQRTDLERFKENRCAVFALELFYGIDDPLNDIGPAVTAGGDDCKIDLLYINKEQRSIVVIQAYEAQNFKPTAKGNKGADLSYAIGVLFSTPLKDIPEGIRPHIGEARDAIKKNEISMIHFWYLHNCPESTQVKQQMLPLLESGRSQLREQFKSIKDIDLSIKEVGLETLDEYYRSSKNAILIEDEIILPDDTFGYIRNGDGWEAFMTSITGEWLSTLYKKHKDLLFSANVRGFMGANNKDKDKVINAGIQKSAKKQKNDFFVFNNGVTALVHDYEVEKNGNEITGKIKKIRGLSIVNGAQTTGSLGTLEESGLENIFIGIRFIKCSNLQKIQDITRFNNSQNIVIPSDFKANDPIQKRLRESFKKIKIATYDGGLRGHKLEGDKSLRIDAHTAAQALVSWHGNPKDSYHKKTKIWDDSELYNIAFQNTITAQHLVFVFTLLEACNLYKENLLEKMKDKSITSHESTVLSLLNERGSSFMIIHAISHLMETILEHKISKKYAISFIDSMTREECIDTWIDLIEKLSHQLLILKVGLKKRLSVESEINASTESVVRNFGTSFIAIKGMMNGVNPYQDFVNKVQN